MNNVSEKGYIPSQMNLIEEENRTKQIVIGASVLTLLAILTGTVILYSHSQSGVFGEWLSMMVGLMTTPVLLEISAFIIGLIAVLTINHWREKRAGDEFVYLDQQEKISDLIDFKSQVEAALKVGNYEAAHGWVRRMSEEELTRPETQALILQLTSATGEGFLADSYQPEPHAIDGQRT